MSLWRRRVKHPRIVSGAGCMFVLLSLLLAILAFPAQPESYACAFSHAGPESGGIIPVTAAGRYEASVSAPELGTGLTGEITLLDRHTGREHWIGLGRLPAVTPDGRYLTFLSRDDRLAPGDRNRDWDIVLYDRVRLRYELITVSSDGTQPSGPGELSAPSISADGRFVVFSSSRPGLVTNETGGVAHVYLRDRLSRTTTLLTLAHDGDAADGPSWQPVISPDGREVIFHSSAANLTGAPAPEGGAVVRCTLSPVGKQPQRDDRGYRALAGR
jgi:hypothetical protein